MWKGREASCGVCRFIGNNVLACMPDAVFPLAGAEDVHICRRDCDRTGVPKIPDSAYEEVTVFSKHALQPTRRFDSSCGAKKIRRRQARRMNAYPASEIHKR